jgi:hypothetical protein
MADLSHRMEEANPGWFVLYDAANQEIIALPRFDAPATTIIRDRDPAQVVRKMRRIEELTRVASRIREL